MNQSHDLKSPARSLARLPRAAWRPRRTPLAAMALAVLAAGAPAAKAGSGVTVFKDKAGDSISLFGIIDAGMLYQSNSTNANGTIGSSITRLAENGRRESEWGIKGQSGDLGIGGHTTAFFNLESHFSTITLPSTTTGILVYMFPVS